MSVFSEELTRNLTFSLAILCFFAFGLTGPIYAGTQRPNRIPVQPAPDTPRDMAREARSTHSSRHEPFHTRAPSMLDNRDLAAYIANKPDVHYAANHKRTLRQIGIGIAISLGIYLIRFILVSIF